MVPVVAPRRLSKAILIELVERFDTDDHELLKPFLPDPLDRITRLYLLDAYLLFFLYSLIINL